MRRAYESTANDGFWHFCDPLGAASQSPVLRIHLTEIVSRVSPQGDVRRRRQIV
jgi:hypothetical protein